jgi:tRNA U34 5-methylaminomethyl-2-thiouridine-forming methyltransferase MnmC
MKRKLILTRDGSHTLYQENLDEHYHSVHGAMQESRHVFIDNGLAYFQKEQLKIFEVGFGTGLNALLSSLYSEEKQLNIDYSAIEKYPLETTWIDQLNYQKILGKNAKSIFEKIHQAPWGDYFPISETFNLKKTEFDFIQYNTSETFDLVYFDAFAPDKQPELWSEIVFTKLYTFLNAPGVFVTYSAKGVIKRRLQASGFKVEKLPGPPGKREMIRALKV